ncbi:MAG: lipopolysaccharide biosynthesis protein [Terriglobales bacterium]
MSGPSPDNSTEAAAPPAGSSVRRRLVRGFGASAMGPVVTALVQLVSVPVFLRFWGAHLYGEWMVLSAIPTYLSLSDMGFGSVAGNDMTMRVARGDRAGALESFQSTWVLVTVASLAVGLLVCAGMWWLPLGSWFHLSMLSSREIATVLVLLSLYALVVLQGTLILAGFRCEGNYPAGMLGGNIVRLTEWTAATVVVLLGGKAVEVAATYLVVRACGNLILTIIMRRKSPWIHYGVAHATRACIRRLAAPAVAFMAFPLGNALSIQGLLMAIGIVLGPVAVAVFSTLRTLTRAVIQLMGVVHTTVWPEISIAYGSAQFARARQLHRHACRVSLWLSISVVTALTLFGRPVYVLWTHHRLGFDAAVFHVLLCVIIANTFWYTSSVVAVACNAHQKVAIAYVVGTLLSIASTFAFTRYLGLLAPAISLLAIDVLMTAVVLPESTRILRDDLGEFLKSAVAPRPLWKAARTIAAEHWSRPMPGATGA